MSGKGLKALVTAENNAKALITPKKRNADQNDASNTLPAAKNPKVSTAPTSKAHPSGASSPLSATKKPRNSKAAASKADPSDTSSPLSTAKGSNRSDAAVGSSTDVKKVEWKDYIPPHSNQDASDAFQRRLETWDDPQNCKKREEKLKERRAKAIENDKFKPVAANYGINVIGMSADNSSMNYRLLHHG
jgi:hypothetical protein